MNIKRIASEIKKAVEQDEIKNMIKDNESLSCTRCKKNKRTSVFVLCEKCMKEFDKTRYRNW